MKTIINIDSEFITLGQFFKLTGEISNGGHIKFFLEENEIYVNGELEKRRGKKLYKNYEISFNEKIFIIN